MNLPIQTLSIRLRSIVIWLAVMAMVLSACAPATAPTGAGAAEEAAEDSTVIVLQGVDITTLDPHYVGAIPEVNVNRKQSLALATIPPGVTTKLHRHLNSEELYHITVGHGRMILEQDSFDVTIGDTVCIPPGTAHQITNTGREDLNILCCCAPAYRHDDTELL